MPLAAHASADAASPWLELRQVHLRRGGSQVFAGLSLHLAESRIGLIGHNGAGKTSLLRLLCALEAPQGGQVQAQAGKHLAAAPAQMHLAQLQQGACGRGGRRRHSDFPKRVLRKF